MTIVVTGSTNSGKFGSTFLELCKKTREKSGISGDGPSNVSGQTGMYAKIVEFVKNAHEEVQLLEAQWRFDWAETTQALTIGQDSYNPADWGLSVKQWRRDTATNVRVAHGLIAWYMKACGFKGWTSFWGVIYMMPGYEANERLLRHERKHLEQIERDGRVLFSIKYLWWLCRYGYFMNPYEVEARNAETLSDN